MAENYFYGETTVNALGLLVLVVLAIASILVPRRYAAVPILVLCCFVAPGQRIVLAGLDFSFMRIILMAGWARVLIRGELSNYEWKPIDAVMLAWAVVGLLAYTMLWGGASGQFIWRVGDTMETYGAYILFRCLVKDWTDLRTFLMASILLVSAVVGFFAFENQTRRNLFAVFGGVPPETMLRQGRLRCQGAFAHPILAGCFYATLMPMYVGLFWSTSLHRLLAAVGILASLGVIFFCASSTPILAVMAAMVGGALI
ncbi:MAG: hypothetical protein KDA28_05010, partial [Phycisphaerales bacterium]|nr:hypothetical protein [Phycisphaerales bacterium]